jgi:hypothetical protein
MTQPIALSLYARFDLADWTPFLLEAFHLYASQPFDVAVRDEGALAAAHSSALVIYLGAMSDPYAMTLNRHSRTTRVPLLLAQPASAHFRLGPLVMHGTLPCLQCYRELNRFLPFNGFTTDEAISAHPRTATAMNGFGKALVQAVNGFFHDPYSPLRQGKLIYAGAERNPDQSVSINVFKTVRNVRYAGCPVCSSWAFHPAEPYVAPTFATA